MKNRVIAATLLSALAATPALAQQAYPPTPSATPVPPAPPMRGPGAMGGGMGILRMADANGDGIVTRAEYLAAVDARFDRMDVNHDGVLTPDEMPMRGGRGGRRGGMGDDAPPPPPASGGTTGTPPAPPPPPSRPPVTREQYRAGAMRRFDRLDTNHDGRIDQTEMAAADAMRPGRGGGMGEAPPPAGQ